LFRFFNFELEKDTKKIRYRNFELDALVFRLRRYVGAARNNSAPHGQISMKFDI